MTDRDSSAASGSAGPPREPVARRDGRDVTTPRAEVNRLAQAAFRQRQKVCALDTTRSPPYSHGTIATA